MQDSNCPECGQYMDPDQLSAYSFLYGTSKIPVSSLTDTLTEVVKQSDGTAVSAYMLDGAIKRMYGFGAYEMIQAIKHRIQERR